MIRFLKKLVTFALTLALLLAFGYCVLLPRVLPLRYQETVQRYAAAYALEESLVYAVIRCESNFDADAVSPAGAIGLMQVTQETGQWAANQLGMDAETLDLTDAETNIRIGCWYLSWLEEKFEGETATVLAGYNAGHGNVARWLADAEMSKDGITLDEIPYAETKRYVKRVETAQMLYRLFYRL